MMSQTKTIHERAFALPKGEATTDNPVVPGVKVLGIESKNGRRYPLEVMKNALEKYEGAIVNIDHPAGSEPRSYEDRFGRLTNARMESDGIYADLAYNPKHPLAEGFQWWVKNDPKAIGLSHNAQAKTKMNEQDGVEEIEEIVAVDSVDLVAEPATTAGLMECVMKAKESNQKPVVKDESSKVMETPFYIGKARDAAESVSKLSDQLMKTAGAVNSLIRNSDTKPQIELANKLKAAIAEITKSAANLNNLVQKSFDIAESAKGNRMNVMEGEIRSSLDSAIRGIEDRILQAYNKLPNIKKPLMDRDAYSEMSQAFGNLYNAFKEFKSKVEQIDKKAPESKPSKKLNVAEAPMTPKQKSIADKKAAIAKAYAKQGVVTMRAIDKNEYPPIPGMEGPFQYRNGQILYYDPKEGKYYDRKTDMYQSRAPESVQRKVAEAKRRKAIRRKLVAEALKEIFSVKKGV